MTNLSLFKTVTTIREQALTVRADVFNLLNTPSYAAPSSVSDSTTGGLITGVRSFQGFSPNARVIQLGAKYQF